MTPAFERGMRIAYWLASGQEVTSARIREEFNTSAATAKRALLAAEVFTPGAQLIIQGRGKPRVLKMRKE